MSHKEAMKHGSLRLCIALAALPLASIQPAHADIFGAGKNDVAVKVAELPNPDSKIYPLGLDFSVDGSRIAVESQSGKINIWEWRRGRVEKTIEMPRGFGNGFSTNPIGYSPDGLLLAVCDASGAGGVVARVWSTITWLAVKDLTEPTSGICTAWAFTPDGQQFIRTADTGGTPGDNLIAYAVSDWQSVWGLPMSGFTPISMAISPNSELAAVAGTIFVVPANVKDPVQRFRQTRTDLQILLIDFRERKIVKTFELNAIGPLAWSPNSARLAIVGAQYAEMFDVESGRRLSSKKIDHSGHMNVRFTSDGRYLIEGDLNGMGKGLGVDVWDGQRNQLLQHIPVGDVGSLAVSRDGKYLGVGETGRTTIWQFK
jgi:WD40 repeat protein